MEGSASIVVGGATKWKSVSVDPSSIPQLHCDCQFAVVLFFSGCVCVCVCVGAGGGGGNTTGSDTVVIFKDL
jgi:hypothetical protein